MNTTDFLQAEEKRRAGKPYFFKKEFQPSTEKKISQEILDLVAARNHVSFIEMCRLIPGFESLKGEGLGLFLAKNDTILLWSNVTNEGSAAINSLVSTKKIKMVPTTTFVYLIDGGGLDMPIAKSNRKYKKMHWYPVTFARPE